MQIGRPSPTVDRRRSRTIQKITPFLWYATEAEEAAAFYTDIFPNSRVVRVTAVPGTSGTRMVEFELFGQPFTAMSHPRTETFNHAISLMVSCADQAELDRYWSALLDNGGTADGCGWLRDRFGVSWQIVPDALIPMMTDRDAVKAARVAAAMMQMTKFDVAALKAAYAGTAG
ncbi:VOC family protein [Burkholderia ambifaria]|uniref:VOC family protein n=1 Tax=Burkholderia ambifaria TaxID=152480 RepID=UPI00158BD87D|nr:VOC family protein [Burkholderia ambifaria]